MKPFQSVIQLPQGIIEPAHNHYVRRLSAMKSQFLDVNEVERRLKKEDLNLYEVYENTNPEKAGELQFGTSIVHPGKIGNEFFMTKGHFHSILETSEAYYCLNGRGIMMMENPEGDWQAAELTPGVLLYVPPRWAHRSINTGDQDLITYFVYPADAGHDYGTIEEKGFRKLVIEREGRVEIVDNPKWK